MILGLDFNAYQAIAWLAWVPNAILAELYLKRRTATAVVRESSHGPLDAATQPPTDYRHSAIGDIDHS